MEKLISMTDFVLEQLSIKQSTSEFKEVVKNYVRFLKQPLQLWMFVPCKLVDGVWMVFEEPHPFKEGDCKEQNKLVTDIRFKEYQEARERCLFEGFEMDNSFVTHKSHNSFFYPISCLHEQTIEDLVKYNLELTKTAQKQIGL